MKKFFLAVAMILGLVFSVNANAQAEKKVEDFQKKLVDKVGGAPKAAGIRLGWGIEAFYQHEFKKGFVEVDLGFLNFSTLDVGATYNFMIAQPDWTNGKGEWGFYAGPGAAIGFGFVPFNMHIAVTGQVGLEYTFWFPLKLSVDLRPQLGVMFGEATAFYWGIMPGITAAYRF